MTTYSKETALYDTGAIATDIGDAGTKATNFLAVDSSGIMVYDGSNGAQTPSTATSGTKNVFIDSDSVDLRNGTTTLASFAYGNMDAGGTYTGTQINSANSNIGIFPGGVSAGHFSLLAYRFGDLGLVNFGGINQFAPEPTVRARSTNADISFSGGTMTNLPLNNFDYAAQTTTTDTTSTDCIFAIDNGAVKLNRFDGVTAEVTASAYIRAVGGAASGFIHLFLYDSASGTTTEIAASGVYIPSTSYGLAVQLSPRIVSPLYMGDKLILKVRTIGNNGKVECSHNDTFMTVKLI